MDICYIVGRLCRFKIVFMFLPGLQPNRAKCERFAIRHVEPQTTCTLLTEASVLDLCLHITIFAIKFLFSDPS